MKKILVINGSPKGRGNTYKLSKKIEEVFNELEPGKFEFEQVILQENNIELCKGCFLCLTKGEQLCSLAKDKVFVDIRAKMLNADGIIFASPTYSMNVSWMMKNFLDRFAFVAHRPEFLDIPALIISTTGGTGTKECLNALSFVGAMGFTIADKLGIATVTIKDWGNLTEKIVSQIYNSSMKFLKLIHSKKPLKPTTGGIIQFQAFKVIYTHAPHIDKEFPADYNYWEGRGWLKKDKQYYTDYKLSFFQKIIAFFFSKFMKKMVSKM